MKRTMSGLSFRTDLYNQEAALKTFMHRQQNLRVDSEGECLNQLAEPYVESGFVQIVQKEHRNFDLISPEGEMMRRKLLKTMEAINHLTSKEKFDLDSHGNFYGERSTIKFFSPDRITLDFIRRILLTKRPHSCIIYPKYSGIRLGTMSSANGWSSSRISDERAKWCRLFLWTNWLIQNKTFNFIMLLLICLNSIVLGIIVEITGRDRNLTQVVHSLELFDKFCFVAYTFEFAVRINHNWQNVFLNFWNIGDLVITYCIFPFYITQMITGEMSEEMESFMKTLKVIRVLRTLKIITRFRQMRVIALALTQAMKTMVYLGFLIGILAILYAIAGMIIFEGYTKSDRVDKEYADAYESLPYSFLTLVQLYTLDHWRELLVDTLHEIPKVYASPYIVSWVWLSNFIFENLFVGILATSFQKMSRSYTAHANKQLKDAMDNYPSDTKLKNKVFYHSVGGHSLPFLSQKSLNNLSKKLNIHRRPLFGKTGQKSDTVEDHLENMRYVTSVAFWNKMHMHSYFLMPKVMQTDLTFWRSDVLCHYFSMLESLMENMMERKKIMDLFIDNTNMMMDMDGRDYVIGKSKARKR
ncbi:hypothetical protein SNEBB_003989 [Seison nebaliae]|nr:hypothetical protein SNEBB_003989 [Seison nebaliae]